MRVDRVPLASKLVDLPCIIESLKTVDKKTFYKTADVCQVEQDQSIVLRNTNPSLFILQGGLVMKYGAWLVCGERGIGSRSMTV